MKSSVRKRVAYRGGVLISALAFVTISSMLVVGMLTMSVGYYTRGKTEADYEAALALAEAGANYEFQKISANTANADQASVAHPTGVSYSVGAGTFTVFCSNKDGSTPWVAPNNLYVNSVGTVNSVSRTIRISGKGYGLAPNFAVFGIGSFKIHASNPTIVGDCGTDGTTSLHGHISGSYYVCGAGASGSGAGANCPTVTLPQPILWPTVDQKATALFPNSGATAPGGLLYLASHNNNASAGLPTTNATITTPVTLTGPGNYFVTSVTLAGTNKITFNNTNGPINLWVGPAGSAGMVRLDGTSGGTVAVPLSTNPVVVYVATSGGVQMHSSPTITADWYVYNGLSGSEYGPFSGWNSPTVNGSVLCYDFFNSGDTMINYMPGVPCPYNSIDHYGFDDQWLEQGGMF